MHSSSGQSTNIEVGSGKWKVSYTKLSIFRFIFSFVEGLSSSPAHTVFIKATGINAYVK